MDIAILMQYNILDLEHVFHFNMNITNELVFELTWNVLFFVNVTIFKTFPKRWNI